MYAYQIGAIIREHSISYHIYADDIQLYLSFDPNSDEDRLQTLSRLTLCINEISAWMSHNKLKLNDEKSEFFIAASPYTS